MATAERPHGDRGRGGDEQGTGAGWAMGHRRWPGDRRSVCGVIDEGETTFNSVYLQWGDGVTLNDMYDTCKAGPWMWPRALQLTHCCMKSLQDLAPSGELTPHFSHVFRDYSTTKQS